MCKEIGGGAQKKSNRWLANLPKKKKKPLVCLIFENFNELGTVLENREKRSAAYFCEFYQPGICFY